jgi:hypothetical protein
MLWEPLCLWSAVCAGVLLVPVPWLGLALLLGLGGCYWQGLRPPWCPAGHPSRRQRPAVEVSPRCGCCGACVTAAAAGVQQAGDTVAMVWACSRCEASTSVMVTKGGPRQPQLTNCPAGWPSCLIMLYESVCIQAQVATLPAGWGCCWPTPCHPLPQATHLTTASIAASSGS